MQTEAAKEDQVLIQGDFGATWFKVTWAMAQEMVPVYSTSRRWAKEMPHKDGNLKTIHVFKHVYLRESER